MAPYPLTGLLLQRLVPSHTLYPSRPPRYVYVRTVSNTVGAWGLSYWEGGRAHACAPGPCTPEAVLHAVHGIAVEAPLFASALLVAGGRTLGHDLLIS